MGRKVFPSLSPSIIEKISANLYWSLNESIFNVVIMLPLIETSYSKQKIGRMIYVIQNTNYSPTKSINTSGLTIRKNLSSASI